MNYKINPLQPPNDTITVRIEVHGKHTLIVPSKTGKQKFPNLTRSGRGRGKGCRGWTHASRKALRVRLADHEAELKTHLCFKFPHGSGEDCRQLKSIQDKLFRWIRAHLGCRYVRKVEFSPRTESLHWHAALDVDMGTSDHRKLSAYCRQFGLVASVSKPESVTRYMGKKRQTFNPDWFARDAFKPWSCTFPKPVVEAVEVPRKAALEAGAIHPAYGLKYGGAAALMSLNTDKALSLNTDKPKAVRGWRIAEPIGVSA